MLKNTKLLDFIDSKKILIYFLMSLTICGFVYIGSIEIFFNNWKEYGYNFIAFIKNILPDYILYSVILAVCTYIISCTAKIISKIVEIFFLTALIYILVNLVFFPVNTLLDGRETVDIFSKIGIANIILLPFIALIVTVIYLNIKEKNRMLMLVCIISSVFIVFNTMSAFINSTYKAKVSTTMKLSTLPKDCLKLSKNKNIIYLVLDQFDSYYFNTIINGPDGNRYKNIFKDFTYFNNYASYIPSTVFSGITAFAGKSYDNSIPYDEFRKKVFSQGYSLFEILKKDGWDNILYNHSQNSFIYAPDLELYGNAKISDINTAPKYSIDNYIMASLYRTAPFFMRNIIKNYSAMINKNGWDFSFIKLINNYNISENNKNTFMLIHLKGTHMPYNIDENLNLVAKSDEISQAKASLKVVELFLNNLKKSNEKFYNNSVIMITTDHGFFRPNAICLIKGINEINDNMKIDDRPLSQIQVKDLLYNMQNGMKSQEIKPQYKRLFNYYTHLAPLENGYYTDIYEYVLPDLLPDNAPPRDNKIGEDRNKYKLLKIYSESKEFVEEKSIVLNFPENCETQPKGISLGGWKCSEQGLQSKRYPLINIRLANGDVKKKVLTQFTSSINGDNNYVVIRSVDGDSVTQKFLDNYTSVYKAKHGVTYAFYIDPKTIIKEIKIQIEK